jgi:17beta-estradiol 17-dehydrogenase / very-long-chain 3-oxoacyl-CoA reductase
VTGPTSGIGKSFAFALAKNGFHLILVSRSKSKLEELEAELEAKYPNLDYKLVDVDVGAYPLDSKYANTLGKVSSEGDIRILINNAGRSHDMPVTFEEMENEEMEGILGVNNAGVLRITKTTLPYLLNDKSLN